ncbi:hypothetical protein [Saprospira grandis]|uniref:Uncharacterized protein n=1 Tax=Saprospira grandis (strain Lewin) TaxID=984262 RepID=H6L424_SAPGL|nr:hypothetical protein [Saprospira grandis]AFC23906.1 hypothetical protein SGRA_1171 [Saprospira grandis str. Lewin]
MNGAYQFLKKHGVTISFSLGALLSLISIFAIVGGFPEEADRPTLYASGIFNPALNITYLLIFICTIVAIVGPVLYMAFNIKESIKFLATAGAMLVVFFVTKAMGTTPTAEELVVFQGNHNHHLEAGDVAFVDGLLLFAVVMIFLSIAAWVFSAVWDTIKS